MAKNIGKKGIEDDKTLRKSGRWDNLGPLFMGWPKTSVFIYLLTGYWRPAFLTS